MIEVVQAKLNSACSGGKRIPRKHLLLGLTVKSFTGSKTMIYLLNCFGDYARDETIRRINLCLEEALFKGKTLVPSHVTRKINYFTCPA